MNFPWEIETVTIEISKHFALGYMGPWGWDLFDLREAIKEAYQVKKVGKEKYEIYTQKKGFKKIITVYYDESQTLFCITGSQGGSRK